MLLATIFTAVSTFAANSTLPVEYEIIDAKASCQQKCKKKEDGTQSCFFKIFFDEATFNNIKAVRKEKGLGQTWFPKSPKAICEAGELPEEGQGTGDIKVMLYKIDRSPLSQLF